jgi:ABC-type nickel/cobalt efflux system permease component RcnA
VVVVGIIILGNTARSIRAFEAELEVISGGLIAFLGLYLLGSRGLHILRRRRATADQQLSGNLVPIADGSCGHAHIVKPQQVAGAWSWRSAWLLALSVGVRPCTGAVLLMVFAWSQGMIWAGLLGTFAMALGTAATVSLLATLAVGSRELALRATYPAPAWSGILLNLIVVAAGIVLIWFGATLALTPPVKSPFMYLAGAPSWDEVIRLLSLHFPHGDRCDDNGSFQAV